MKVEKAKTPFTPVTITLESPEEIRDLLVVVDMVGSTMYGSKRRAMCRELREKLNAILNETHSLDNHTCNSLCF